MREPVKYRKGHQSRSLFEEDATLETLSKMGNALEFISGIVDFELFRGVGLIHAKAYVAMTNLAYNIARLAQIHRYYPEWITVSI